MTLMSNDRHKLSSLYERIIAVASTGASEVSHSLLQELLDEYATLRVADRERELVTLIHEWWLTHAEKRTVKSPLDFSRDLARTIVRRGFIKTTRTEKMS